MKKIIFLFILFVTNTIFSQTELPQLSLKDTKGEDKNLKTSFTEENKLYIFSFWATWCAPCIQELDAFSEEIEEWNKEFKVEIVAVATDDARTQKRVKPLINGKGWDFTVLLDSNQDLKRSLGIANIPYTIVLKNNKIVHIQNGFTPGSEKELYDTLKKL